MSNQSNIIVRDHSIRDTIRRDNTSNNVTTTIDNTSISRDNTSTIRDNMASNNVTSSNTTVRDENLIHRSDKEKRLKELRAMSVRKKTARMQQSSQNFDRSLEQLTRDKIQGERIAFITRILDITDEMGYKDDEVIEYESEETVLIEKLDQPLLVQEPTWNGLSNQYRVIQDMIISQIFDVNIRLKKACQNALSVDTITDQFYDNIISGLTMRTRLAKSLSMNSRSFCFYVREYIPPDKSGINLVRGIERKYTRTERELSEHLELWERTECYKIRCGVPEQASEVELRIFRLLQIAVLTQDDINKLVTFLSSSTPLRENSYKYYTAKFKSDQERLKSVGFIVTKM